MLFKRGSKSLYVRAIQLSLNAWSGETMTPLAPDGIFGPMTEARVRAFQQAHKPLKVDGIVGPNTFSRLFTGVQLDARVRVKTTPKDSQTPIPSPSPIPVRASPAVGLAKSSLVEGYTFPMGSYPFLGRHYTDWVRRIKPPVEPLLTPKQRQELHGTFQDIHFGSVWRLPPLFPAAPSPAPWMPGIGLPPLYIDPLPKSGSGEVKQKKKSKDVSHLGGRVDFTFDPTAENRFQAGTVLTFGILGPPEKSKLNLEVMTKPLSLSGVGPNMWDFEVTTSFKPYSLKPLSWMKLSPIILSTLDPESWQFFVGAKAAISFHLTDRLDLEIGGKFGPKYEFTFDPKDGKSHHKIKPFSGGGSLMLKWHLF